VLRVAAGSVELRSPGGGRVVTGLIMRDWVPSLLAARSACPRADATAAIGNRGPRSSRGRSAGIGRDHGTLLLRVPGWAIPSLAAAMEFGILGPLEVCADGGVVEISGAKRRALLVMLALRANRPVSVERLAVALWGEDAPPGARKAVHVSVSRLRRALGEDGVLQTTPAGYRLVLGPDDLDAVRFERAVAAGRQALAAGEPERAAALLRGALGLWRAAVGGVRVGAIRGAGDPSLGGTAAGRGGVADRGRAGRWAARRVGG